MVIVVNLGGLTLLFTLQRQIKYARFPPATSMISTRLTILSRRFNMRRLADDHPASAPVFRPTLPIPSNDDTTASSTDPVLCPFSASARVDEKGAATSPATQVMFVRSVEQRLEGPATGPLEGAPSLPSKGMSVGELRHAAEDEATATAVQRQQAQQLLALKKVQWDVLVVRPSSRPLFPFAESHSLTSHLYSFSAPSSSSRCLARRSGSGSRSLRLRFTRGGPRESMMTREVLGQDARTTLTALYPGRRTEVAYFLVPWMFVIGVDVALTLLLLNVVRHFAPTNSFLARVLGQGSKNRRGTSASGLLASDDLDSLTMASSAADPDRSTGVETANNPRSGAQTMSA